MNFILSSKEDCNLASEENFESLFSGLKSLRTREVWHEALEKKHAAQVKKKSLLEHLLYSEVLAERFLELDIFSFSRN